MIEPDSPRATERLIADLESLHRYARELRTISRELLDRAYVLADEIDEVFGDAVDEGAAQIRAERDPITRQLEREKVSRGR